MPTPVIAAAPKVLPVCRRERPAARLRNISPALPTARSAPQAPAPADPATRWTAAHRGPAFFAYSTNYLIDVDNAIIVDVEATTAIRQAEILAAKRLIERSLDPSALT